MHTMSIQMSMVVAVLSLATLGSCDRHQMIYLPSQANQEAPSQRLLEILSDDAIMSLDDMSTGFRALQAKSTGVERNLFDGLVELANVQEATCSRNLIKTYLDLFKMIDAYKLSTEHAEFVNKYSHYLESLGRIKFANCAAAATSGDAFERLIASSANLQKAEEELDQFIAEESQEEPESDPTDEHLYELARWFESGVSQKAAQCAIIREALGDTFDVYNLAVVLVKASDKMSVEEPSIKFRKLNEYNRICLI